jgi:hypothetical protein
MCTQHAGHSPPACAFQWLGTHPPPGQEVNNIPPVGSAILCQSGDSLFPPGGASRNAKISAIQYMLNICCADRKTTFKNWSFPLFLTFWSAVCLQY